MQGMLRSLALAALLPLHAQAATPAISIIIDDLGDRPSEGRQVVELPGPIACAFLPGTPHGAALAREAHAQGKEVLLHFPLEPVAGKAHPQAITVRSDRSELARRLRDDLNSLPFLSGVNTHQGSLLTQRLQPMYWLMSELKARGKLYFVDSFTIPTSVALRAAQTWGLPSAKRDVFLDDLRKESEIRGQLMRLIARAKRDGSAIGIGHPYPETIAVLKRELPLLASQGVRLVAPSEIIALQGGNKPARTAGPYPPLMLKLSLSLGTPGSTLLR